ncbi:MAG: hypothetical protein ACJ75H_22800 [Thermoanaerobaculia bacterium]
MHLQEIGRLQTLQTVAPLVLPDLVVGEIEAHGSGLTFLREAGVQSTVISVETSAWREVLRSTGARIQPADAQVFVLARDGRFQPLVLTDDLALRRLLEKSGSPVTGTVGILIRAYSSRLISREDLDSAVEALFESSSLHLSGAFRIYLTSLLNDLA